jgi:hypothetical protein
MEHMVGVETSPFAALGRFMARQPEITSYHHVTLYFTWRATTQCTDLDRLLWESDNTFEWQQIQQLLWGYTH